MTTVVTVVVVGRPSGPVTVAVLKIVLVLVAVWQLTQTKVAGSVMVNCASGTTVDACETVLGGNVTVDDAVSTAVTVEVVGGSTAVTVDDWGGSVTLVVLVVGGCVTMAGVVVEMTVLVVLVLGLRMVTVDWFVTVPDVLVVTVEVVPGRVTVDV